MISSRFEIRALSWGLLVLSACHAAPEQGSDVTFGTSARAVAPPGSDARFISENILRTMAPGERTAVLVQMRNDGLNTDGTNDWDNSYALYRENNLWFWVYQRVTGTVAPPDVHDFRFVITAPTTNVVNTYDFGAQMRILGDLPPFGDPVRVNGIIVDPGLTRQWACQWDQTNSVVPASIPPGAADIAIFRVQNVGQQVWDNSGLGTCLRSRDTPVHFWGSQSNCVYINQPVPPGGFIDVPVPLTAPATEGTFPLARQMFDFRPDGVDYFDLTQNCIDTTITVATSTQVPPLDAVVVSHNFPATLATGESRPVTVQMRNTGTETWTGNGDFVLSSDTTPRSLLGVTIIRLRTPVATGEVATFNFTIRGPATPGTYDARFSMRKLVEPGKGLFGELINTPIDVGAIPPQVGATVVSQNIPTLMTAGSAQTFEITMRNNGNDPWNGSAFRLASINTPASIWGNTGLALNAGETVAPGTDRVFTLNVTAPAAGVYDSRWQMQETTIVGLFGEQAITTGITVTECGNRLLDPGEQCDDGNLIDLDGCSSICQDERLIIDLVNPSDKTIYGSNHNKLYASVAIGDVTGDGTPEIITGEISNVVPPVGSFRNQAGKIFAYPGTAAFLDGAPIVAGTSSPTFTLWGRRRGRPAGLRRQLQQGG